MIKEKNKNRKLISVNYALEIIDSNTEVIKDAMDVPVENSFGCILKEDIYSSIYMPPFRQSAMDGFAVNHSDEAEFDVIGEIRAGDPESFDLKKGQAVKIFTGARVPESSNAVVQIENVTISGGKIKVAGEILPELNIRPKGEQIRPDEIALKKGILINPAAVGYLKMLGLSYVKVSRKPVVSILVTGNELQVSGTDLKQGKVYESNSAMLYAALNSMGINDVDIVFIKDDLDSTIKKIRDAAVKSDILITSGGISAGDYDFVKKALELLSVEKKFYKVNQKPGKPLYYGILNNTHVISLPGNPGAALTCFYLYIHPMINKLKGLGFSSMETFTAVLNSDYKNKGDRTQILKTSFDQKSGKVDILDFQSSAMLNSFSDANSFLLVKTGSEPLKKGDKVSLYKIPKC